MLNFKLQAWHAVAPELDDPEAWRKWLKNPGLLAGRCSSTSLKQIPPMLRRRFSGLGKCTASVCLDVLEFGQAMPVVFASRHGDTHVLLGLLEGVAAGESVSPTQFSLAVHNAISGLISIARKDVSAVTAISACDNLVPMALLEAAAQLQQYKRVLCVIYDMPLPDIYLPYSDSEPHPVAIGMVLSQTEGEAIMIKSVPAGGRFNTNPPVDSEVIQLMRFVCGLDDDTWFEKPSAGSSWHVTRQ